jgi:hypothetical protein
VAAATSAPRRRPGNLWSGDDEAQRIVRQFGLVAGYESVRLGGLSMAATQEGLAGPIFAIAQSGLGQFVYRMASPEQL